MTIKDFKVGQEVFKRKCRGKYYVPKIQGTQREYQELKFENGEFLGFGVDYEEYENGFAQYTMAIVELQDGQVIITSPENIQFAITNEDKSKTCIDMPE